ncbi:MAG: DUF2190 family protein [Gammaproteobacteria bacterium]|nr:DUF2190 family protein [Gammaproteobacteria bacterium]
MTFSESQITHPSHTDTFVDKGDPCVVGENIVGVSFKSAAAATDLVAIDTEGIWQLSVVATDEDGSSAVAVGDELFINLTTCILSKNKDKSTHQRFGFALYPITGGATDVIPVKVHFDPDDDLELVGTSSAFKAIGTANNAREYRYRSIATSGDVRGQYMALALNGIGGSGEAHRGRTIVEAVGVLTAHGGHHGLEFDTDGTITGLGVGHRATFMCPNRAAFATIAGGMSELWAEGSSTDFGTATVHSIHRFVMDGDPTGYATGDNVFEFVNLSAVQYAGNTDTADHALRCIINGNVRYIMISEAQS